MNILIVLTSHDTLGDTDHKTGVWLEEFAAPYYTFLDAGAEVVLASPRGGRPPIDPRSLADEVQTDATRKFADDSDAQWQFDQSVRLTEVYAEDFDALFFPGGHGPLWDLANDPQSIGLINAFIAAGKPVAAVCHGPCVFLKARTPDGDPLVEDKKVTGFTNSEEAAIELTEVVPFSLEDELTRLGGNFVRTEDWGELAVEDKGLVTGQNPASSVAVAQKLLALL